ncbi:MAG: hypothetical protein IKH63_03380 [Prevotella sp.]|nr:hypothetical protein [Prevotella sp.]
MAKRILVVEDDPLIFEMLNNALASYVIVRARAVDEACGAVEENGPFDCFVVDLKISASGLTLEEMAKYQRREGYAFLKNYLWKGNENEIKELKRKTIICSRYVYDLRKEYGDETDGLQMVLKDMGFETKVASLIEKICR